MKTIIKYKAFDGLEFFDDVECELHETNCNLADSIMKALPEKIDSCDFSNGSGFIQHEKETLLKVRNRFLDFAKRYSDHKFIQQTIDKGFEADASWAGRIISECAPNTIYKHWSRFSCIDKSYREWGQAYFASNPKEGKQVRLN